ncbi:MAG: hypothetical protein AAB393_11370 [Bacteroidota bacterium]
MNPHIRKAIAQFTLAAFVLAAVLLEIAHHDHHSIELHTTPAVTSHECGSNEIHLPLDKRHECLACSQSTQRIATTATTRPANTAAFWCLSHIPPKSARTLHADVIHSGKRGPPVS